MSLAGKAGRKKRVREAVLEGYLKVSEAAERLGVTKKTITRWIEREFFPGAERKNPYAKNSTYIIPLVDIERFEKLRRNPPVDSV